MKITDISGRRARGLSLALLAGTLTLAPARAHAFLPAAVTAVVAFYETAYGYLSKAQALFGDSGPDLVAALNQVQANVINEIRSVRNQAWKAHAQTVFDDFQILGLRKRNHKDNVRLWGESWDLSRQTINDFVEIVNARDVASVYEMAPAFNALVAVNGELTKMEGEIYPGDPPAWGEYDLYFKHGIRADYAMVGMKKGLCWPGFNPGAGHYNKVKNATYARNTYLRSMLYEDKIANKNILVDKIPVIVWGRGGMNEFLVNGYCNPGKHTCLPLAFGIPSTPWPKADSLDIAEAAIKPTWDADPIVTSVRSAMLGIMSLGGGDDNFDNENVDLPMEGSYTEPWIYEPDCNQAVYPYAP
jgi:hypothetical protein